MLSACNCIVIVYFIFQLCNRISNCIYIAILSNLLEGTVDNSFSRQTKNFATVKKLLLIKSI